MARILKNTLNDNALDVNLHGTIGSIYNLIMDFRNPAGKYTSDNLIEKAFATLDQPGTYYFKLFFYFNNPYSEVGLSSNLLGVEYNTEANLDKGGWGPNTALNYLYNNREYTRFRYLAEFIQLLSDINTQSPWYFQSISGLDTALERTEFTQRDFKIEDERKKISIKCLSDALDNRIGKLLDLYRAATYSQALHKEVIPANLRKFDMGIYIFTPLVKQIDLGIMKTEDKGFWESVKDMAANKLGDLILIGGTLSDIIGLPTAEAPQYRRLNFVDAGTPQTSEFTNEYVSSKYIELRNCEIDLNSSKGPFSEFSNAEGKQNEYEISISFDTCYEQRYDTAFNDVIGDFVIEDLYRLSASEMESNKEIVDRIVNGITDDEAQLKDLNYDGIIDGDEIANAEMANTINAIYSGNKTISQMNVFYDYEGYKRAFTDAIANGSFKEAITGKLEQIALNTINAQMERGATQLRGLAMGNIYGFSLNDITSFGNKASSGGLLYDIADGLENGIGNRIIKNESNFTTDPKDLREGKPLFGYHRIPEPKEHKDGNLSLMGNAISEPVESGVGENIYERGNSDNGNLSRGWTKRSISR